MIKNELTNVEIINSMRHMYDAPLEHSKTKLLKFLKLSHYFMAAAQTFA